MDKFTISIPLNELKAAAIFASEDEARYMLRCIRVEIADEHVRLISTDGRRLVLIESKACGEDGLSAAFSIPVEMIRAVEKPLDSGNVIITVESGVITIIDRTSVKKVAEDNSRVGTFPDWRKIVPPKLTATKHGRSTIQARYLADIYKAEKLLCPGVTTAIHIQPASDDPNSVVVIVLEDRLHHRCALYCLLMPLREDDGRVFDMTPPAWALPAPKAQAMETEAPHA
ncbi:MAG: hypothetical protein ABFC56_14125 [Clostridiaceae bacterium]